MSEFEFKAENYENEILELEKFVEENKNLDGALMPVLQKTQSLFGYLPREILEKLSRDMQIPIARIYGVATFYAQFTFIPTGKYKISVCTGTACFVKGAEDIQNTFKEELGIELGGTTPDEKFSLIEARCLGQCSLAPVVTVNGKVYPKFKIKDVSPLIEELRREDNEK